MVLASPMEAEQLLISDPQLRSWFVTSNRVGLEKGASNWTVSPTAELLTTLRQMQKAEFAG
jgi:hypothetical protein